MIATSSPQPQSKSKAFREQLPACILVADGAMGTVLYGKGIFINRCFDELNLSMPELVKETHRDYVKAGAEIVETNTFGANRTRLATFGLADKLTAINQAGVRLAPSLVLCFRLIEVTPLASGPGPDDLLKVPL